METITELGVTTIFLFISFVVIFGIFKIHED